MGQTCCKKQRTKTVRSVSDGSAGVKYNWEGDYVKAIDYARFTEEAEKAWAQRQRVKSSWTSLEVSPRGQPLHWEVP